jgi:chromosome segregation ATPase
MGNVTQLKVRKNKTETEVAVLQVQVQALDEKVDEIKSELKEMRDSMDKGSEATMRLIKEFQTSNQAQHDELAGKVETIEKWRWMLMGAAAVAGAMGWETVQALFQ